MEKCGCDATNLYPIKNHVNLVTLFLKKENNLTAGIDIFLRAVKKLFCSHVLVCCPGWLRPSSKSQPNIVAESRMKFSAVGMSDALLRISPRHGLQIRYAYGNRLTGLCAYDNVAFFLI